MYFPATHCHTCFFFLESGERRCAFTFSLFNLEMHTSRCSVLHLHVRQSFSEKSWNKFAFRQKKNSNMVNSSWEIHLTPSKWLHLPSSSCELGRSAIARRTRRLAVPPYRTRAGLSEYDIPGDQGGIRGKIMGKSYIDGIYKYNMQYINLSVYLSIYLI